MSAALGSLEHAMYEATKDETLWLQNVQRALHTRSKEHLGIAFTRVQRNRGARTVGIDRVTVRKVLQSGVMPFLDEIRKDLRGATFRPAPVRRVFIPKAGQPGKFRPWDIPTVKDTWPGRRPLPSWQRLRRARCVTKGARRVR